MNASVLAFAKYCLVGLLNTFSHWVSFGVVFALSGNQAKSNLIGFLVAVSISFYFNARWTFNSGATLGKYIAVLLLMSLLSWGFGKAADDMGLHPLITLILFSGVSLVFGFLSMKCIVFREAK